MDILNPKEGDTHTVGSVTFRVKSVVQDSVEYEILGDEPSAEELNAAHQAMAEEWFNALPRVQLQRMQNPNWRNENVNEMD